MGGGGVEGGHVGGVIELLALLLGNVPGSPVPGWSFWLSYDAVYRACSGSRLGFGTTKMHKEASANQKKPL